MLVISLFYKNLQYLANTKKRAPFKTCNFVYFRVDQKLYSSLIISNNISRSNIIQDKSFLFYF